MEASSAAAAAAAPPDAARKTPGEFVRASLVGRPVSIKLSDGTEYRGVLVCLDGFMNVALEQADEFSASGALKSKLGDCFIRGNNGECVWDKGQGSLHAALLRCCTPSPQRARSIYPLAVHPSQFAPPSKI